VKVYETIEIAFEQDSKTGQIVWQQESFESDMNLFKEVYPSYEFLGWYSTGSKIDTAVDSPVHTSMTKYNDRPLYLLLDVNAPEDSRELPIEIYEEELHVVGDKTTKEWVKSAYKVDSDEAERVTAVHCAKVVSDENKEQSAIVPQLTSLHKAITSLNQRIKALHSYLQDVRAGKVVADQKILREIKGLCNRLPTMDTADFKQDFLLEYSDALLIVYLSALSKGSGAIAEAMEKFNTAYAGKGRGMGGAGALSLMMGGFGPMGYF